MTRVKDWHDYRSLRPRPNYQDYVKRLRTIDVVSNVCGIMADVQLDVVVSVTFDVLVSVKYVIVVSISVHVISLYCVI